MKHKIWSDKDSVFYRKLFSLVLPIAFQQFMLAAVSASDALMLGFVNQDSLSSVSLAGQITFVFNLYGRTDDGGQVFWQPSITGRGMRYPLKKIFAYVIKSIFSSYPQPFPGGAIYSENP